MTERRRVPVSQETGEPILDEPEPAEPEEPCACPHLEAEEWDRVESDWSDITFLKAHTKAVMGVPVSFFALRADLLERAIELGATVPEDAMLLLGPGRFRRPVLLEVEGVDGDARDVLRPGGVAYTRLLKAPPGQLQKRVDQTKADARERYGREPDDIYVWYLTCNKCSAARDYETLVLAHYATPPGAGR